MKNQKRKVGKKVSENGTIEISFAGRGGQTAVTASKLLAQFVYEKGFRDAIAIPIIGAERRGAPISAFTKISKTQQIKTYDSVVNPDYMVVFDISLLQIPKFKNVIKPKTTLLVNSDKALDRDKLPQIEKIYIIDATGICIEHKFMLSSGPILNIPMLSAFGKITGFYDLNTMEKVIKEEFGDKKADLNIEVARAAFNSVKEG
ncbi:MAG: pyruvate ferredoxin oxidoreductase [Candidatus Lokiarchaeota archaeon]|nr:pyruvate ferredoxin oxidoreductase [Candidatus Lokiarchaeota archaeon]MBD3199347.1 pyruvate ferredoxin oxidoreductase [Candidatus Lokiarchaeota archaeon]